MNTLLEKRRSELIDKSIHADRTKSYGTTRYDRRNRQHVFNTVQQFNRVDMNAVFRGNMLSFIVPVQGETNNYEVELLFEGIMTAIAQQVKLNNYNFEYKCVYRAIINAINNNDLFIGCTCLHPSTKVSLLDGSDPTIEELKKRFDAGEDLWVYSTDSKGDFKPGHVTNVFITKTTSDFIKVKLDNGEEIITTPDHPYMLRDGSYALANELSAGMSLMPMYFNDRLDYRQVKLNTEVKGWRSVYKLVANELYGAEINLKNNQAIDDRLNGLDKTTNNQNVAIHHKDFNKSNNNPSNLEVMTCYEHWMYHANNVTRLWSNPDFVKVTSERSRKHIQKLNENPTEKMIKSRQDFLDKGHDYWRTAEGRQIKSNEMSSTMKSFYANISEEQMTEIKEKQNKTKQSRKHEYQLNWIERVLRRIIEAGEIPSPETYKKYKYRNSGNWQNYFSSWEELSSYYNLNHKVVSVEYIVLDNTPVYDMTVDTWHNFRVSAGVILHNCPDFHYRMGYWASKGRYNAGRPEIRPSDSTNPNDSKGAGCKHVMAVIANLDWAMKLATVITNYTFYMEEHMPDLYYKWMFPAIYGMSYEEAVAKGIIDAVDDSAEDDLANTMDTDDFSDIDAANAEYELDDEEDLYDGI